MADPRFYTTHAPIPFDRALEIVGAARGPAGAAAGGAIARAASPRDEALAGAVVFVDEKHLVDAVAGKAPSLVLVAPALASAFDPAIPLGVVAEPRPAFARLAETLHAERPCGEGVGIDPSAVVDPTAEISPLARVAAGARIGARTRVGPFALIGPGVEIGAACDIGPGASVVCALLGARVVVKAGARIGQTGFGFVPTRGGLVRMPQIGRVLIDDDVEIGANSCVDRGALGDTTIESGVKIDNLVQIAHNVRIGAGTVIAAQVGISGSTTIGRRVMLGGKAGFADHLTIGDGAQIAAASGVMHDIPAGARWGGIPARPIRQFFRETATLAKLAKDGKSDDHGD